MSEQNFSFDTIKVRGSYNPKDHNFSVAVPIYQTASFELGGTQRFEKLRTFQEPGYFYTRLGNPTVSVLEERVAALDGAAAALAVSSGMSAITLTLFNVTEGGGRILTTEQLYGGTIDGFRKIYPKFGIQIDKVDSPNDPDAYRKAIKEDTKAIFIESISNPNAIVADIEAIAKVAHEHNIPLIVDNTFATPYLLNPIKYGADIVIYSATKALGGHGNVIAGLVLESGKFNWGNGKYPQFAETSYFLRDTQGIERSFLEVFPQIPFIAKLRFHYLAYFGAALSPFDAYLVLLGLETLSERVQKQISNAEKVIQYLESAEHVAWVNHPSANDNPYRHLAKKYLPKGAGSNFTFGFKGTEKELEKFLNSTKLFSYQANIGDARSLIIDPPRVTHGELNFDERKTADIPPETVRLSIGLEDADDLIADLKQAFAEAFK